MVEKSVEFNKPAYICFIDPEKAFDRIRLKDVIRLLQNRGIPTNLIHTIRNIYTENYVQIKLGQKLTNPIPANNGIRQGDSLSPLLFNRVMDEIIKKLKNGRGYKMENQEIKIICYADDAVL